MRPCLILLPLLVMLAGCTNWKGYTKAGTPEAQAKKDMTECRRSSEIYDRGLIPPLFPDPNPQTRVLHDEKVYQECMVGRGYTDIGWSPFREWTWW